MLQLSNKEHLLAEKGRMRSLDRTRRLASIQTQYAHFSNSGITRCFEAFSFKGHKGWTHD